MALIYDSSHSGQEIDAAVDAVQTTIPSQLTQIGLKIDKLELKGFKFGGFVTPNSSPVLTDIKMFYIAKENGIYTHFGDLEVNNESAIFLQDNNPLSNYTEGQYLVGSSSGSYPISNEEWAFTDFVPYEGGDVNWFFGGGSFPQQKPCIIFYNENKEFILSAYWTASTATESTVDNKTISASDITKWANGAKYLRASFRLSFEGAKVVVNGSTLWVKESAYGDWSKIQITKNAEEVIKEAAITKNYTDEVYLNKEAEEISDSNYYLSDFIPVKKGDRIVWNFSDGSASLGYIIEYDSNKKSLSNEGGYWSASGAGVRDNIVVYTDEASFIRASFKKGDYSASVTVNGALAWQKVEDGVIGALFSGKQDSLTAGDGITIENNVISASGRGGGETSGIVSLNPEDSVGQYIIQSKRPSNPNYQLSHSILSLAVFTDIHGDADNLQRFIDFCKHYGTWIDDKLHLGDTVADKFSDGLGFWNGVSGADTILNTIGNHDTANSPHTTSEEWYAHAGVDAYNMIFAPYISKWNVVQPSNASANGKCWYYKDYTTEKVRLIVLDCMLGGNTSLATEQLSWFESTLASAKSNNLSVVVAKHNPNYYVRDTANNPFNTLDYVDYGTIFYELDFRPYYSAVDSFIDGGGEFITWMCGDAHYDMQGYVFDHPNQYSMTFETAMCNTNYNDSDRVRGQKSQDSFNIVTFDTESKLIKIVRIGNNCDRYLRSKQYIVFNYSSKQIVAKG